LQRADAALWRARAEKRWAAPESWRARTANGKAEGEDRRAEASLKSHRASKREAYPSVWQCSPRSLSDERPESLRETRRSSSRRRPVQRQSTEEHPLGGDTRRCTPRRSSIPGPAESRPAGCKPTPPWPVAALR